MRRTIAMALIGAVVIGACGGRSVHEFCDTYHHETERLEEKYSDRFESLEGQDPMIGLFAALGATVEAMGDLVVMYDRMEERAPDEIRPDVAAVRDALAAQVETLRNAGSDPLAAMFGGLVTGMAVSGSDQRVNVYISDNCGI